ncbi:acyl-CoA thioesterase II [Pseudonocardia sp. WMMC193]|uniref:acyl-CoA thioesterase n=1 Tax=Pseudonocardia sp. WMMC193 TaxID=2911965 RepID=UPI001F3123D2|nr:acyl-CoA thioesterase domain-containing protein [Pseudonocardia sp. WMMC193]MCF7549570.1 thioesterase family protein [Pseudonocardia sp. WMMC193]
MTTPMPTETARTSAPLRDALDLRKDGDDAFVARHQGIPSGRAYGGELVAQAVHATTLTCDDDRRIHSFHGYFLRAGDVRAPTRWEVERVRDGRGFSHRAVRGVQHGREVFRAMAQFGVPAAGVEHAVEPPADLGDPEALPTTAEALGDADTRDAEYWRHHRSVDIRHSPSAVYTRHDGARVRRQTVWLRAWDRLPDDPALHRSALAYVCDYTMLEPILRAHGAAWADEGVVTASLDHAMWWHHDGRIDGWVALVQDSPVATRGTGLGTARLFSADGRLLASVVQEGLVRLP